MFMDRFNRTLRQVRNAYQRLIMSALTTALRLRPFVDYLYAEEPQTMDELQNRLASFIRIEEGRAYQKGKEVVPTGRMRRESGIRRTYRRDERVNGQRWVDQAKAFKYVHHT